jgi:hypothetical protein
MIYGPPPPDDGPLFFTLMVFGFFVGYWIAQTEAWARLQRYVSKILRYEP